MPDTTQTPHCCSIIPNTPDPVVLTKNTRRVELHLRRDEDNITTLLAYAGAASLSTPERATAQSPYQNMDQAIGARRAIIQQLLNGDFQLQREGYPIWSLHAQRDIKQMRSLKVHSQVDYRFDPKDVFLDW
ncbi:hypothetical protein [Gilvimarinus chinensis]|uniref:PA4575 family protein n=1 Tax=Gilvimarinus chinensis TaxID=396005 RepID=UPI00037EECAC|nr:hypothetical protein [Gilvimarinus chinensis]